jgi:trans-aconitate methyltransferase
MPVSFDSFTKNYNEVVNEAIHGTGYDTEGLVAAKLQKIAKLFPSLPKNKFNLLDFGCGVGNLYGHVAHFFPKAIYTGVDLSKSSIKKARSRFQEHAAFQEYDSIEWELCKYDLIFSAGVFHHIPHIDHPTIIEKLSCLLNPGGELVIWEHNPLNPVTQKIVRDCPIDEDAVLVSSKNIKKNFERVSLADIKISYTTFFPHFLSTLNILDPYLGWLPLGGQYLVTGKKG